MAISYFLDQQRILLPPPPGLEKFNGDADVDDVDDGGQVEDDDDGGDDGYEQAHDHDWTTYLERLSSIEVVEVFL
ncbi:hypothetical protein OROGR_006704 [Orobanche gracilis]